MKTTEIIQLDEIRWATFSDEAEKKMARVMKDFLSQAKMGDWNDGDDFYDLRDKFYGFARSHADKPADGDGWTDSDVEEVVVWILRKVAKGTRWQ